ncbi:putative membrane protein [Streptomyces sp. SLBN-31]|jgi:putative membrane protein|nr:SHOCT domain-containing protein [Streptomyces sp. SLBN-31]TQJ92477.1 putative membrane protein [Streptomyces sp. SLBN-31]
MMFWYNHDVSGWGWFAMSAGMILFWALIIGFGVVLYRALSRPSGSQPFVSSPPTGSFPPTAPAPTAEQLLGERFARGEIDEDEYHRKLSVLRGGTGPRLSKN